MTKVEELRKKLIERWTSFQTEEAANIDALIQAVREEEEPKTLKYIKLHQELEGRYYRLLAKVDTEKGEEKEE